LDRGHEELAEPAAAAPVAAALGPSRADLAGALSLGSVGGVLALQQTAGNLAVAHRLAGLGDGLPRTSRLAVQRVAEDLAVSAALSRSVAPRRVDALLSRQVVVPGAPGPGGGGNQCLALLGEILSFLLGGPNHTIGGVDVVGRDIHRGLIERYEHMRQDPHQLFRNHRGVGQAHPQFGSWEGHQQTFRDQARGLRERLNNWQRNGCNGPDSGVPELAHNEVRRAWDYATREPPVQPAQMQAQPAERTTIDPDKVLKILAILGISLALLGLVIVAVLDPEPVTKLAAIGLTVATATTLLVMLGLRNEDGSPSSPASPPMASAGEFPEREAALA
jgi:hypothetical protein